MSLIVGVLCAGGIAAGVFFVQPQSALSEIWHDAVEDATSVLTNAEPRTDAEQANKTRQIDRPQSDQIKRLEGQLASLYEKLNVAQHQLKIVTAERDEALAQAHLLNQTVRPSAIHRQSRSGGSSHESLARDMSVRRAYGPLIRPGKYAFGSENKHPTGRPASFSTLRDQGVTREYNRFVNAMTGRGYYRNNDRRPFYEIPRTPSETALMKKLFEEFEDLGPVWVQMGVLRP